MQTHCHLEEKLPCCSSTIDLPKTSLPVPCLKLCRGNKNCQQGPKTTSYCWQLPAILNPDNINNNNYIIMCFHSVWKNFIGSSKTCFRVWVAASVIRFDSLNF